MSAKLFEELLAAPSEPSISARNAPAAILEVLASQRAPITQCVSAALRAGRAKDSEIERIEDSLDLLLEKMKKGGETWASMPSLFTLFGERFTQPEPERFIHALQRAVTDFGDQLSPLAQRASVLLLQDAYWTSFDLSERRALYDREAIIARKIAKEMLAIDPTVPAPEVTEPALTACLNTFLTQWSRCKAQSWIASQLEYIRLFVDKTAILADATEQWTELLLLKLEQEIGSAATPRRAVSTVSHATEALLEAISRIATLRRISTDSGRLFEKANSLWRITLVHVVLAAAPGNLLACEYAYRLRPDLFAKLEVSATRIGDMRQALLDSYRASLERMQLDWLDGALRDLQRLAMAPEAVSRTLASFASIIDRTADRLTEGLTDQRGASLAGEHMRMLVREVAVTLHCTADVAHGRQRLRRVVATFIDVTEQPVLWRKARQIVAMLQLPESLAAFGADNEARVLPCIREIADAVTDQFTFVRRWWAVQAGVGDPNSAAAQLPNCYPIRSILDEVGLFRCVYGNRAGKEFTRRVSLTLKENTDDLESLTIAVKSITNALKFEALPASNADELLYGLETSLEDMAAGALLAVQAEHITALAASHLSTRLNASPAERTAALGNRDMAVAVQFGRTDTLWTMRRLSQLLLTTEGAVDERMNWWWSIAVAKYIVRLPSALAQYHVEAVARALREILPEVIAERTATRIEALYRRLFDMPKAASRGVSLAVPIPAETKQRRSLLAGGSAATAIGANRDAELAAAAPESLRTIATGLHSALLTDADEEMLWVVRTAPISAAIQAEGADALESQWRRWVGALDQHLPPTEAARWTMVLLRGLQYVRDVALCAELRTVPETKLQRIQAWLEPDTSAAEKGILTAQRIGTVLRSMTDAISGAPPSLASLNASSAAIELARTEPALSTRLWQRFWGALDTELPMQSGAARMALAGLCAQMLGLAEGLEDAAAFSRWLAAQTEPLFAEDATVERDWRATLMGLVVCAISQGPAPMPAAAMLQRLILWSAVLERQTADGWSDTWAALDGVLSERMVPRLRGLLIGLNGPIANVLYARSKVAEQIQFDGARRYRALLSGLPQAESAWILSSLTAAPSPVPDVVRDEMLLAAPQSLSDGPVDPIAIAAMLTVVAKMEVPAILKRRLGLLRRETQNLDEADREAIALSLRLAAMHRVMPAAELRRHLHETLTQGVSKSAAPNALNTLKWFISDCRDRLAKQREPAPVLDVLQQHALGLTAAARFAEQRSSASDTVTLALRQIASGLQGTCGTLGLRIAVDCLEAGLDPEKALPVLERACASVDAAASAGSCDVLTVLRTLSGKTRLNESAVSA
jgi:hypothetical protein